MSSIWVSAINFEVTDFHENWYEYNTRGHLMFGLFNFLPSITWQLYGPKK